MKLASKPQPKSPSRASVERRRCRRTATLLSHTPKRSTGVGAWTWPYDVSRPARLAAAVMGAPGDGRASARRGDDRAVQQQREHEQLGAGDDDARPVTARWFCDGVGPLEREVARDVRDDQRDRHASPSTTSPKAIRTVRVYGKMRRHRPTVSAGVVEQHLGDAAEEERLEADGEHRDTEELRVQREVDEPSSRSPKVSGSVSRRPRTISSDARLDQEEVGAVDEHRPQVDPRGLERREPALPLVVAHAGRRGP